MAGQAGRLLRVLVNAALALVVVVACLCALLAWRLSRGPLDVTWAVPRLLAMADSGGGRLSIGHLAIAWAGFRDGVGAPIELLASDVAASAPDGAKALEVARAEARFAVGPLLLGRVELGSADVSGARVAATRSAQGKLSLDLGGEGPARGGAAEARLDRLRVVRVHDASLTLVDHALGVTWLVPGVEADLRRGADGGIEGEGHGTLRLGDQSVEIALNSAAGALEFHLSSFNPARWAGLAPGFDVLAALDAPVTVEGRAEIGPDLVPSHLFGTVEVSGGVAHIAQGTSPLTGLTLAVDATRDRVEATLRRLEVAARPDGARTLVHGHVLARRTQGRVTADIRADLDQVAFADLPALWPNGLGGPGTKPWITKNITDGVARAAQGAVTLEASEDFSDVTLRTVKLDVDGHDLTVAWLRPVPPAEHLEGHLSMTTPDAIEIAVGSGHQAGGAVTLSHGRVHLSGLAGRDQLADIETDLAGPLADVVALLKHPRLKLLDRSPVALRDVAGQVTGHLGIGHLPLKDSAGIDDIQIKARAHVTGARLAGLVAGRDLDHGTVDLEVGNDGMAARGDAILAGVPSHATFDMDFRNGPASQVVEKVTAQGTLDEHGLEGLGLGTSGVLTGPVPVRLEAQFQRGGRGEVAVHADMNQATVRSDAIDFSKVAGTSATGEARVVLDHDRVTGIDGLRFVGPGVDVRGEADFAGGRPNVLRLASVRLGETNLAGEITLPAKAGDAYGVRLAGPSLDASGFFGESKNGPKPKARDDAMGPAYSVDARIDRVKLAGKAEVSGLVAQVENDGRIFRSAEVAGRYGGRSPFSLKVRPAGRGRRLEVRAEDAGGLLRAVDVLHDFVGGRLSVNGIWDDTVARHPLTGSLELDDFRVRDAPVFGKLLQAMTLYGLVDAVTTGPGLNFTRAVVPFRLAGGVMEVGEARAFSASLGMTAKGSIDLDRKLADLQGTVVPAYFFNNLLGNLPLLGRVFSPEKGGGVFSVTYSVKGRLDNPAVSVNPLAALTPGFLRGLFDGFGPDGREPARGAAGSGGNR